MKINDFCADFISKIDLNFHIKDKEYNFNNISLYYEEIKYQSIRSFFLMDQGYPSYCLYIIHIL